MRNETSWQPSKFVMHGNDLSPSRDPRELAVTSRLVTALVADFYTRVLPLHVSGELLDLGCGKQPLYAAYRDLISSTTAVDWPLSVHVNNHVDAFCDLSRPLPFRDACFDTVLCSDVLEHLPDPMLAFSEIARVLKTGGVLVLTAPFLYVVHEAPHDYMRHTRYSLESLSQRAGLDVMEISELGGALDVLADLTSKFLGHVPFVGNVLAYLIQTIVTGSRRSRICAAVRYKTAHRFPAEHGLVAVKRGERS